MMTFFFIVLMDVVAVAVLYTLFVAYYYHRRTTQDEILHAITADGLSIAVLHFKPAAGALKQACPVLFVHGLAANRHNFAFPGHYNPVRYMQESGFDCWVVELRGRGYSTKPHYWSRWQRWRWTFDDYVTKDLPAAIAVIQQHTGAQQIDYVGHSMGGMILYAALITNPNLPIRRAVTLGANACFKDRLKGQGPRIKFLLDKLPWLKQLPFLPVRLWVYVNVLLLGRVSLPWSSHPANPENMDPRFSRRIFFNGIENVSKKLLTANFADWVIHNAFRNTDGTIDYKARLAEITTPVRIIAGQVDQLADPENVRFAWEKISSPKKDFILLARAHGYSADYGHVDMIFGPQAGGEVYPLIKGWLEN